MKVLQVMAGAEFGGAEEFFTRLVIALHKTDLEQSVFIRENSARAERLIKNGVKPTQLEFGGRFDFKTPWILKRNIKSFKPDIVFSWMNRATSMCPAKGAFIHVGRLGGYYNLKYYRNCDYLVANTEDIVTYVVNNGWSKDKVFYLPNFASEKWSQPIDRKNFTTPSNAPLILAMGRLHENKAFDVLFEAVSRVPNVYLWLAGDGPLRRVLESQAEKLGIKSRIRFLGWRDDPEKLYAAADMFVCPSRHEPLGNVIIESWAQRIPVIAADSLGPKDLIRHGENGLLFSIDDVMGLVGAINQLIEDHALREKLVSKANQDFTETFTDRIVVAKYREFFEKVSQ
jgi:glycosyltransferase involved in cell wall biosynthesis